jgi:hypothetical protein
MDIKELLQTKFEEFFSEMRSAIREEFLAEMVQRLGASPKTETVKGWKAPLEAKTKSSSRERREKNRLQKDRIVKVFKKYPERGFTMTDLRNHLKNGDFDTKVAHDQLKYLVAAKLLERIGNAWRVTKSQVKIKKARKIREKAKAARQENLLQLLRTGKSDLGFAAMEISKKITGAASDIRKDLVEFEKDGLVVAKSVEYKNSRGHQVSTVRWFPVTKGNGHSNGHAAA